MKPVQVVNAPRVIQKICQHLGLPTALPPVAPARAPPQDEFHFDTDDAFGDNI